MKKIFSTIIVFSILFGFLLMPLSSFANSELEELIASLREQIQVLKNQISELSSQIEEVKEEQSEIKEMTLQLRTQLRRGMRGEDISLLQEFLATDSEIYPEGLITGYFGFLTETAVKRFQKKMGVEQVGQVGPKTFTRINELLRDGAGSSGKVPPGLLRAPGIQRKIEAGLITPPTDNNGGENDNNNGTNSEIENGDEDNGDNGDE